MINGKLQNGFEFCINSKKLSSWQFVKLSRMADKEATAIWDLYAYVFGPEQLEALENHMAAIDEDFSIDDMVAIVHEIMTLASDQDEETKKS